MVIFSQRASSFRLVVVLSLEQEYTTGSHICVSKPVFVLTACAPQSLIPDWILRIIFHKQTNKQTS